MIAAIYDRKSTDQVDGTALIGVRIRVLPIRRPEPCS
jgi:hypothetical protein